MSRFLSLARDFDIDKDVDQDVRELPLGMLLLGMLLPRIGALCRDKQKKIAEACRNFGVARSDPSNQGNPIHPDETLNSVASLSGSSSPIAIFRT